MLAVADIPPGAPLDLVFPSRPLGAVFSVESPADALFLCEVQLWEHRADLRGGARDLRRLHTCIFREFSRGTPAFCAILVAAHLYLLAMRERARA